MLQSQPNQHGNTLSALIAALAGQRARPQGGGVLPISATGQEAARPMSSDEIATTMFGTPVSPLDREKFVDSIIANEMNAPTRHWSQVLMRGAMGGLKSLNDARARQFETAKASEDAQKLASSILGVRSGMDDRGNVDLTPMLSGATTPQLVEAIVGYADRAGAKRGGDFRDDRRYERGVFENDRSFRAGREDEGNQRQRQALLDAMASQRFEREMAQPIFSATMQGEDDQGNAVFFRTKEDGSVDKLQGVRPSSSPGGEYNRKITPAEAAKNREISAARDEVIRRIQAEGLDWTKNQFDPQQELVSKARESMVGADDPAYDKFLQILSGQKTEPQTTVNPQEGVQNKDQSTLIPNSGGVAQSVGGEKSFVDALVGAHTRPADGTSPEQVQGRESLAEALQQQQKRIQPAGFPADKDRTPAQKRFAAMQSTAAQAGGVAQSVGGEKSFVDALVGAHTRPADGTSPEQVQGRESLAEALQQQQKRIQPAGFPADKDRTPAQKRFAAMQSTAAQAGMSITVPAPRLPTGKINPAAMRAGEFYEVRGPDGRTKVVTLLDDNRIEVVVE